MASASSATQAEKELAVVSAKIRKQAPALEALYQQRLALYAALRANDPPVPVKRLAELAGVSEASVTIALSKVRKAAQ